MTINSVVKSLKENNQDFEFYPTTREIIYDFYNNISKQSCSILDIGAGNGNLFSVLDELNKESNFSIKKYAIEKSQILINNMPDDIYIIGTDFYEQSLIDKQVDIIFCNPPYSDFEGWAIKIINECNCKALFLVIPDRWSESEAIKSALKNREKKANKINSYSFVDSEYRKARANVNLVKITAELSSRFNREMSVDPFDLWFDTFFKIAADKTEISDYTVENNKRKNLKALVNGKNVIENLVKFYNADQENLLNNYKAIEKLDSLVLKELNVNVRALKEGLKSKISGLKNLYWKELFNNFNIITDKLTVKSREKLVSTLTNNTNIDFTASNAYSVTIWAIKNANKYFDSQLLEVYENITQKENVVLYKSNKHINKDGWRYESIWDFREGINHYSLDYRIVHYNHSAIKYNGYNVVNDDYDYPNNLSKNAHNIINDIITVAKNLGFNVINSSYDFNWIAGKPNIFEYVKNGKALVFAEIKAFMNGNLHFKFNQDFMKKFNIEAGRLNGWIKSPQEAINEIEGITKEEALNYFKSNIKLLNNDILLLPSDNREPKKTDIEQLSLFEDIAV